MSQLASHWSSLELVGLIRARWNFVWSCGEFFLRKNRFYPVSLSDCSDSSCFLTYRRAKLWLIGIEEASKRERRVRDVLVGYHWELSCDVFMIRKVSIKPIRRNEQYHLRWNLVRSRDVNVPNKMWKLLGKIPSGHPNRLRFGLLIDKLKLHTI